ncbi:MAG: toll/interleukin-1 receptor domain-containing protein [Chloroflexota bacterium]
MSTKDNNRYTLSSDNETPNAPSLNTPTTRHHYICYSPVDGDGAALALYRALQRVDVPVWVDLKDVRVLGRGADAQMEQALRSCEMLLLVVTAGSVSEESDCVREWRRALQYKKPIIPIKIMPNPDVYQLPFALEGRTIVDMTDLDQRPDEATARLREYLRQRQSDEGLLQTLQERMADAQRDLREALRADDAVLEWQIRSDIDYLREQFDAQQALVDDPEQRAKETQLRIDSGLERARQPDKPVSGPREQSTKFINSPPSIPPDYFQNRTVEIGLVVRYIADPTCRLITVVGRGGVGKTAMVCYLLRELTNHRGRGERREGMGDSERERHGDRERGRHGDDIHGQLSTINFPLSTLPSSSPSAFSAVNPLDGIVYLSAIGARTPSVPHLVADLCKLLPSEEAAAINATYRNPQSTTRQVMHRLLAAFAEKRVVVLMDNFETLVDSEQQTIHDIELAEALTTLLDAPHHGVTVLITTRVLPHDLQLHLTAGGRQQTLKLDTGLELDHATTVLRALDETGGIGLRNASDNLLERIWQHTRGYPRALESVGAILKADRYTTPEEVLAQSKAYVTQSASVSQVAYLRHDVIVEALVGQAYSRLDPTAQRVMQALAVYNRPMTVAAVDYLLQPTMAGINSAPILQRLANMHFVRRDGQHFFLHPMDRAYTFGQIPAQSPSTADAPAEDAPSWNQNDLLARAADYFKSARTPRSEWRTLDDLKPQLAEFDLRCAGGDYDSAAAVLIDIDSDYLHLWGHLRLMAQMHERLLGHIVDNRQKSIHVGRLGIAYSGMGQVERAINCYNEALSLDQQYQDKQGESTHLGNLGLEYAAIGEVHKAIGYYEQALIIACEIGDRRNEGAHLGNLGSAYHRVGEVREAIGYSTQALAIAREIDEYRNEGTHLGNLGLAYATLGAVREAIDYQRRALAIAREIGDRHGEGNRLGNLGNAYMALGEVWKAIGYYEQALATAHKIADRRVEGIFRGNMGRAYAMQGDDKKAVELITEGLEIHRETHNRRSEGTALGALGYAHGVGGDWNKAVNRHQQSMFILEEVGDRYQQSNAWNDLAEAYLALEQLDNAKDALDRALTLAETVGNRRGVADAQWLLGKYYLKLDENDAQLRAQAVAAMMVCVDYFEEIGHVDAGARRAEVEALS